MPVDAHYISKNYTLEEETAHVTKLRWIKGIAQVHTDLQLMICFSDSTIGGVLIFEN